MTRRPACTLSLARVDEFLRRLKQRSLAFSLDFPPGLQGFIAFSELACAWASLDAALGANRHCFQMRLAQPSTRTHNIRQP